MQGSNRSVATALVTAAVHLRCPACGRGEIYRKGFDVHPTCPNCGQTFTLAEGEFTGGAYLNYLVTTFTALGVVLPLMLFSSLPTWALLVVGLTIGVGLPLAINRNMRALWMAIMFVTGALEPPSP